MSGLDDIDIFGVPVTGSTRDRDLDRLEQMVRGRYIDPLEQQAKDMVKNQVVQALSGMEGVTGAAIAQVVALADSQDPNDKLVFNQIVSRLNLPVNIRRMGDDYMASKRFEGALGRDSSVDVMAYRPDEGETQYSLGAQKRFPNLLGKNSSADVSARVSTMGDPEIRARFEKRFAEGGEVDIFDNPFRDPVYEELGFTFDPERNQYYEVIEDPEYGAMRRYYSPRDREPVPELSDARMAFDEQLQREDMARYLSQMGALDGSVGGVSDADMSRFGRLKAKTIKNREMEAGKKLKAMKMARLMNDIGFDANANSGGGVGSLEMDFFRRSQ